MKKSQHKYVIGPKGNSLQEILERTGVSVEIPPSDSISETVILRGEPEKLGQALTEVYAKVVPSKSKVCFDNFWDPLWTGSLLVYPRDSDTGEMCPKWGGTHH